MKGKYPKKKMEIFMTFTIKLQLQGVVLAALFKGNMKEVTDKKEQKSKKIHDSKKWMEVLAATFVQDF